MAPEPMRESLPPVRLISSAARVRLPVSLLKFVSANTSVPVPALKVMVSPVRDSPALLTVSAAPPVTLTETFCAVP
ncbi:MAG: hypothetical protein FD165_2783, partial [Gammaproteobacteria bacterium]